MHILLLFCKGTSLQLMTQKWHMRSIIIVTLAISTQECGRLLHLFYSYYGQQCLDQFCLAFSSFSYIKEHKYRQPIIGRGHHYKKRGLQPRVKNATIDLKNAAIGYSRVFHSRVFKRDLFCGIIAPVRTYSRIFINTSRGPPIAAFFTSYNCILPPSYKLRPIAAFLKTRLQTNFGH